MVVSAVLAAIAAFSGCAASPTRSDIPQFAVNGSRPYEFASLEQLADLSSAVIVATPTGESFDRPLPRAQGGTADSAPTVYVRVTVDEVLEGTLKVDVIDLVSPGIDERTGKVGLLGGGPYLLFITPAMYAADAPAGGYVVVGGPAGVFAGTDSDRFVRVDSESPKLPEAITRADARTVHIVKTEAELLSEGPR